MDSNTISLPIRKLNNTLVNIIITFNEDKNKIELSYTPPKNLPYSEDFIMDAIEDELENVFYNADKEEHYA
jgi:hypothetical protein